jgi:hypothetical protein
VVDVVAECFVAVVGLRAMIVICDAKDLEVDDKLFNVDCRV